MISVKLNSYLALLPLSASISFYNIKICYSISIYCAFISFNRLSLAPSSSLMKYQKPGTQLYTSTYIHCRQFPFQTIVNLNKTSNCSHARWKKSFCQYNTCVCQPEKPLVTIFIDYYTYIFCLGQFLYHLLVHTENINEEYVIFKYKYSINK